MQVRTNEGETVDSLCWRALARSQGAVEATLELNPGLAERGPILPAGLLVTLPDTTTSTATQRTIKLWD